MRKLQYVFCYFVLVLLLAGVFSLSDAGKDFETLALDGELGDATVTRLDCGNHASFLYELLVDGKKYQSRGWASNIHKDCQAMKPGELVPIFYVKERPAISFAANSVEDIPNGKGFARLVCFVLPAFLIWIYASEMKRRGF